MKERRFTRQTVIRLRPETYEALERRAEGLGSTPSQLARVMIEQGLARPTARDLIGLDPDFTGGLSTEEYMTKLRGE